MVWTINRTRNRALSLWADQSGATQLEYALIAAITSVAIVSAAPRVGTALKNLMQIIEAIL